MPEPTPGPWQAIGRGIFAGELHIATTTHPRDVEEQPDGKFPDYDASLANAALLAAAPELYAALKWFVDDLSAVRSNMRDFDNNVIRARAALKAATSN